MQQGGVNPNHFDTNLPCDIGRIFMTKHLKVAI